MNVFGTGLVCARGRGRDATTTDWQPPTFVDVPFQDKPFPVYAISAETLKDSAVLGKMRRADRFSKMAVLAAHDAMAAAEPVGLPPVAPERIGIILGTALGPHVTTFKFLDDIIEYGDKGERKHIRTTEKFFEPLAKELVRRDLDITIINESPSPYEDAAMMKEVLQKLDPNVGS